MHDRSRRIASFNSDKLDGRDRYIKNFKYPHSQKSWCQIWRPKLHEECCVSRTVVSQASASFPCIVTTYRGFDASVSLTESVCLRLGRPDLIRSSSDPVSSNR
ncbi:hypothetical protein NPIL_565221 [Nephila pilipes]|uniref:Uncharacterized protein n=1 Tax=Nephila pilipes TaxID=299642 RepID=A0A8X6UMB7_NEPPI|nr:hypothetical protein NPIL_565221 [Nephila pilipes]